MNTEIFCSTIIPTIGRPTLTRAVRSVLEQSFTADDFEVIVVNDSGKPLPAAQWQQSERVKVIATQQRERSIARNTGAAIAKGRYLHFLDDDDWALPGALQQFWTLANTSSAAWLYGNSLLVDRAGAPLIELQHNLRGNCLTQTMAGEWIPWQSSFIKADAFFAVGGFHPLISGPEDIDLSRRIALRYDLDFTSTLVACIGMGRETSSTDQDRSPIYSRWAREQILDEPTVFARMWASATTDYWRGRVARVYLTSAVWNLKRAHFSTAVSRAMFALASCTRASSSLFSSDFWQAVSQAYASPTFDRGFQRTLGLGDK